MAKWSNILGMSLYIAIMRCLRILLHLLPFSVRTFIAKKTMSLPIWLCRLVLNLVTRPIGDERNWIHKIEKSTWKGVWIVPNLNSLKQAEDTALNNDLVVLYTHGNYENHMGLTKGGGYCIGHATMYMETFQLIINHLRTEHNIRASILSLEYSLSPENVWPKARDEAMEAYRYLTETIGIPSSKIIFAGDSAGGNLAATMLLTIKSQKQLPPAGAALFSPWIDLTINQPSFSTYQKDYLDSTRVETYVSNYIPNFRNLDDESRRSMIQNPLISPLYGNLSGTCPIFLAYGDKELLRTSIENFKVNLENDGVSVTTLKGENALHIWLVYRLVALSKQVYERDCKTFVSWMATIINRSVATDT